MRHVVLLLALVMLGGHSGTPTEYKGMPFAVMNDCPRCIEPFFVPTFQVQVMAGTFPEHGVIQCKAAGKELHCGDGLSLAMERIIFHEGER